MKYNLHKQDKLNYLWTTEGTKAYKIDITPSKIILKTKQIKDFINILDKIYPILLQMTIIFLQNLMNKLRKAAVLKLY